MTLATCRGAARAARRRDKRDVRRVLWQRANEVALPYRMAIVAAIEKQRQEALGAKGATT
jgi:hypothetical protein